MIYKVLLGILIASMLYSCIPSIVTKTVKRDIPPNYNQSEDTTSNSATIDWAEYFDDEILVGLIDSALTNNQELNIFQQEIQFERNELMARKGEYLPFVSAQAGAGIDKVGRYTRNGALEATTDIEPEKEFPEPLGDYMLGAQVSWELDIWRKLRNGRDAANKRYLASIEGRNFLITNLVAEIASSYYELLALDNQLTLLERNITIQSDALEIVRLRKQAAKVTELAVKRFEAQVVETKELRYGIQQQIVETENRINFLVGRYPRPIPRAETAFDSLNVGSIKAGVPSQLVHNRPDIRQAEKELAAAEIDIKVAKANFYPSLGISAGLGLQAFNLGHFIEPDKSLTYSLFGDIAAPLLNRKAIKATYFNASARQVQAVYEYERTVLNAYLEVSNFLAKINNLSSSYDLKSQQVQLLTESIDISNNLFRSARADYMEVLLTQAEALESILELIEIKLQQMNTKVNIYRSLGGGWKP